MSDKPKIPDAPSPPSRVNPQMLLLYGPAKVGKTCAAAALPDSLILELELEGANWFTARKVDVPDMKALLVILDELAMLRASGNPACKRLIIDTIDVIEWWCDPIALAEYKRSVLGKDFQGTSITELPLGAGYGRLRDKFSEMLWLFTKASEEVLLLAHVRDRFVSKNTGDAASQDIDLTGKVRNICTSRCSSIGFLRRDALDNLYANFRTSETVNCGSRCAHLTGREILLGERVKGELVFHWSSIYLPDAPANNGATAAPAGGTVAGQVGALL